MLEEGVKLKEKTIERGRRFIFGDQFIKQMYIS
jgi:hypothetical protein